MRRLMVILATTVLLTAACGSSDDSKESGGAPPVSLAGTTNNHGTKTAGSTIDVEADDFYFGPTFIKATAGQKFTVELENEAKVAHTFTSTALGIDEELQPGQKKTVTVTAPQSGNALFFCRFHQGQGMQGAIFVA